MSREPLRAFAGLSRLGWFNFMMKEISAKPIMSMLAGHQSQMRSSLPSGLVPYPGCTLRTFRGRGSFGEVWEADVPGGAVAMKFMPCNATNAPKEIRTLQQVRQVQHPNLIRIEKVFCCSGYLVVGMELAEGSLQDLLEVNLANQKKPLAAATVCRFLNQMAEVLDFLNARNHRIDGQLMAIRHCDVKPSNMLLFGDTVKLTDFGVTLITPVTSQATLRAGTPEFAAPEVFVGKVTDRTDQYALAVSYYLLRTGQLPFTDTPPDFRRDYIRPKPDLTPLAPRERPVLARALAPASLDRWPSCAELMAQLTKAVQQSGRHRLITVPKRLVSDIPTLHAARHDTSTGGSAKPRGV